MKTLKLIDGAQGSEESTYELVKKSGFYSELDSNEVKILSKWIKAYSAPLGTRILEEGGEDVCLCIIVEGKINIFKQSEAADEHVKVADIKAGEIIGEMGVVDGQPFSASAIAASDSKILLISRSDFENMVYENEKLGIKLLWKIATIISERLRRTTKRLADYIAIEKK